VRPVGAAGADDEIDIKNIRIIAATHKSLINGIAEGWFREDLYYRLNVIEIQLPPLRERLEDLKELTEDFINKINAKFKDEPRLELVKLSDDAFQPLMQHSWQGNIRELKNTLHRAALFAQQEDNKTITAELLKQLILPVIKKPNASAFSQNNLENLDLKKIIDELTYHYYQRIVTEISGISRKSLVTKLSITEPTLRKLEDSWKEKGWQVFPRQSRK